MQPRLVQAGPSKGIKKQKVEKGIPGSKSASNYTPSRQSMSRDQQLEKGLMSQKKYVQYMEWVKHKNKILGKDSGEDSSTGAQRNQSQSKSDTGQVTNKKRQSESANKSSQPKQGVKKKGSQQVKSKS